MTNGVGFRQIAYLPVYGLVSPLLGDPGLVPGTPVWCQLDGTDPAKWQAILWAAVGWTVNEDARQAAMADASREISASEDWELLPAASAPDPGSISHEVQRWHERRVHR